MQNPYDERQPVITVPFATSNYPSGYLPPAYPQTTYPIPTPPNTHSGLKLSVVALFILIGAVVVATTLPPSAAQARKLAYPLPSVGIQTNATTTTRVSDNIQFTATVNAGRDLTYSWDFGDGATASGASASHSYAQYQQGGYDVTLSVVDPLRQTASAQTNITVLPLPPVACFSASQDPNDPLTVNFNARCSTGTQLSYAWDFGDGSTSQDGPTTSHYYGTPRTYTVQLTVADIANQQDTKTESIQVTVAGPQARFYATEDPYSPDCYSFDASATSGYQIQQYQWSFGDGNTDTTYYSSDYHCYYYDAFGNPDPAGDYTVTLTVTDAFGQTSSATQTVYNPAY